jgi:ribosomal protein L30/L7E
LGDPIYGLLKTVTCAALLILRSWIGREQIERQSQKVVRKTASRHCLKELGVTSINFTVILDSGDIDDCRLTPEYSDMLKLSEDMVWGE